MAKKVKNSRVEDLHADKLDIRTVPDKDWQEFESYYIEKVNDIVVPMDLDARGILLINSEIDEVYSEARFDYGYAKNQLQKWTQRLSNAKKSSKLVFKKTKGQTADERDALINVFLETKTMQGDPAPLYVLVERWNERFIFMESVVDNLLKKSDKMVNGNGALKLDSQGRGDISGGKSSGRRRSS